ncbi:uncharacterized protein LOC110988185 isoform X2 [Acanthaster planci]|nr:uncharacterized protein LOC110988185 isoform X2 [Acanthaster planci]
MESNNVRSCPACSGPFEQRQNAKAARKSPIVHFKLRSLITPESAEALFPGVNLDSFVCSKCKKHVLSQGRLVSMNGRMRYHVTPQTIMYKAMYNKKRNACRGVSELTDSAAKKPRLAGTPCEGEENGEGLVIEESSSPMEGISTLSSDKVDQEPQPLSSVQVNAPTAMPPKPKKEGERQKKERVITFMKQGAYVKALKNLLFLEKGRKAFREIMANELRKEVHYVLESENTLRGLTPAFSLETMENFKWREVMEDVQVKMPMTYTVLQGIMPSEDLLMRKRRTFTTRREARETWNRKTGNIVANILYAHNPWVYKFWHNIVGLEMWRQGADRRIFDKLHHLGVCSTYLSVQETVDRIRSLHNEHIHQWKEITERHLHVPTSEESTDKSSGNKSSGDKFTGDKSTGVGCSYSLCWDKIKWKAAECRHKENHQAQFHRRALCFSVQHRTPSLQLSSDDAEIDVHPSSILPDQKDIQTLKQRMAVIVQRILVQHMSALDDVCVEAHIPHHFTAEMSEKSSLVNLGLIDSDPRPMSGGRSIMQHLQEKHCPKQEGKPFTLPCNSCEYEVKRMIRHREILSKEASPRKRLEGLLPTPQEFDKQTLLLQDTVNDLFHKNSINSKGTLFQLKEFFQYKSVSSKVREDFNGVWDLMEFATHAYVVLLAMKLTHMNGLDDKPEGFPDSASEAIQKRWLRQFSQRIVDNVWAWVSREEMSAVLTGATTDLSNDENPADIYSFCSCRKEKRGEKMVRCCNAMCSNGWYHLSCLKQDKKIVADEDWYCSTACKQSASYIYCICQCHKGKEDLFMVQCERGSACTKRVWYHPFCVGLQSSDIPDVWFCSEECEIGKRGEDQVLEYSKRLTLEGLRHLARQDFIREGDGNGLVSCWKLDFLDIWNRNHTRYKYITHFFLANVAGAAPSRLRHELIWERVANLRGLPGKNVPLDQIMGHLAQDCKAILKQLRGEYSDLSLARCSQLAGVFGFDNAFANRLFGKDRLIPSIPSHRHTSKCLSDVATFVKEYASCDLWTYKGRRQHTGIQPIEPGYHVKNPLDFGRYIAERNRVLRTIMTNSQEADTRRTQDSDSSSSSSSGEDTPCDSSSSSASSVRSLSLPDQSPMTAFLEMMDIQ